MHKAAVAAASTEDLATLLLRQRSCGTETAVVMSNTLWLKIAPHSNFVK